MSKYTTEVRFLCETYAGYTSSQDYDKVDSVIAAAAPLIFADYPLFDESYRSVLNAKILKHFYLREIGEETAGLWKLRLNTRMNEIMPYYNKLYHSETLKFDPFHDVDVITEHGGESAHDESRNRGQQTTSNTSQDSSDSSNSQLVSDSGSKTTASAESAQSASRTASSSKGHKDKFSDTPQGSLSGVDTERYLTSYREIDETESTEEESSQQTSAQDSSQTEGNTKTVQNDSSSGTFSQDVKGSLEENESRNLNTTDKWLNHVYGKQGTQSYTSLLVEFRNALINIDMMIIEELNDLFLNLW